MREDRLTWLLQVIESHRISDGYERSGGLRRISEGVEMTDVSITQMVEVIRQAVDTGGQVGGRLSAVYSRRGPELRQILEDVEMTDESIRQIIEMIEQDVDTSEQINSGLRAVYSGGDLRHPVGYILRVPSLFRLREQPKPKLKREEEGEQKKVLDFPSSELAGLISEKLQKQDSGSTSDKKLEDFQCPITLEVFKDPVIASDNKSYEWGAISRLFEKRAKRNGDEWEVVSPLTREVLSWTVRSDTATVAQLNKWINEEKIAIQSCDNSPQSSGKRKRDDGTEGQPLKMAH